ncbi:hypothetical protein VNO80_04395 [Phaseolus coccineus]|uniref:Zinc metalloproteinase aureolysin n=1 Tax=Phaseolus coccineus TaxID=3886 RepID=A0AAN9NTC2_PHACN
MTVRLSMAGFRSSLPFSALIRQVEQEMETVIKVLQPGPLGIIEHKFSADEIRKANTTVSKAVINWRRNAALEGNNHILKDYINKIRIIWSGHVLKDAKNRYMVLEVPQN